MKVIQQETQSNVIALRGRFDANECEDFNVLVEQLKANDRDLIFDLGDVEFIDSTALASLVALSKWAEVNNKTMEIRNPSDPVRVILELTAIDRVLNIVNESAAAR